MSNMNSSDALLTMGRLQEHFAAIDPDKHTNGWDAMWQEKVTPWDRSAPSPALVDTLKDKKDILNISSPTQTRKRAFVPGCGRGYDVNLFAAHGFEAYGLDVSPLAIEAAKSEAADVNKYPIQNPTLGRGTATFLCADFFTDDFLAHTGGEANFDIIYDYTFLCALPPPMRPKWAKRMSQLLAPEGRLVCLEFPLHKPPTQPGPPHGLTAELYPALLGRPGEEVKYDEEGRVVVDDKAAVAEDGLVRIDRWLAERTHEAGKGVDHVSVWKHK